MKIRGALLIVSITTIVTVSLQPPVKAHVELAHINKQPVKEIQPIKVDTLAQPRQMLQVVETPKTPSGSCEDAIAKVWPAHLQAGARLVAQKESGMIADRRGPVNADGSIGNTDGSIDHGCFQINSRWHKAFIDSGKWSDPYANAEHAYGIYKGRGNWTAWYAVQGVLW